ncbi:uncharacterized protein LOC135136984 [Zophobas morio]|uniref:uncharacterized protein LOC135136984 n=1 Tax=Zophobas morio TaxID=2755281 RepID=UPI0030831A72
MRIFLVAITLYLLLIAPVYSLQCYSTAAGITVLEAQRIDSKAVAKDCIESIAESSNTIQTFNISDLRCFTVKINTDKANIAVQGCNRRESCRDMVKNVQTNYSWIVGHNFYFNHVSCIMCEGDLCNGNITRTVVVKSWLFFVRKTNFIVTVVIIILLVMVISIMLTVFWRKRRASERR